ncbi:hypothetical protein Bca4012_067972 [Brassica carinata]
MAQRKQLTWSTISGDNLSGSNKRSSTPGEKTNLSVSIPVDVIINILSRLPLKSIAQCRCVCKLWSSIARRPNYNLLFPIKPPDTPTRRILFAFKVGSNLFFYSSPQQQQDPDNSNSPIVATRHDINLGSDLQQLCRPVRGLVCSQHIGKNCSWAVISNPVTGEIVTTPKLTIEGIHLKDRIRGKVDYSFGYDPINKQFKVLRITRLCGSPEHRISFYSKYHVLTLGTGELSWRQLRCSTLHYPLDENGICENGICIDGVLFYPALIQHRKHMIVCFDVRSEKFSFIGVDDVLGLPIHRYLVLINYDGKLGVNFCDIAYKHFELWVLEDASKHAWSKKRVYKSPHASLNWHHNYVRPAGMVGSGEIVLYRMYTHNPFSIFYYHLEKNIIRRVTVEVPVLEKFDHFGAFAFANYVEDLKLM